MKKIFICFILSLSLFLIGCNNVDIKKIVLDYEVYSGGTWGIESQEKTTIARSTNQMYDFVDGYLRKGVEYNNLKNIYNDEFFMNNDLGLVVVTTPAANFKPIITDYNIESNIMNLKIKVIEEKNTQGIDVVCIDVVFIKLDKSLFINELKLSKTDDNSKTFIEKWNDDKTKRPELLKWFNNNYDLDTFSRDKVIYYFGSPDLTNHGYNDIFDYYYLLGDNKFINENDILYFKFNLGNQIENKIIKKCPLTKDTNIEIKNLGYDSIKFDLDKEYNKISKILKNTHFGFLDINTLYRFDYDFYIETKNDKTMYTYYIDLDKKLIYRENPTISSIHSIFGYLTDKDINYFEDILYGIIPALDYSVYKLKDIIPSLETIKPNKIKIEKTYSGIAPDNLVIIENYTEDSKVETLVEKLKNVNLRRVRKDHPFPPGYRIRNYVFANNYKELLRISFADKMIFINNFCFEYVNDSFAELDDVYIRYDYVTYRFVENITNFKVVSTDGTVKKELKTGLEYLEFEDLRNVDNIGWLNGTIESDFISFEVYGGNIIKIRDKYYQCLNRPVSSYFN